MLLTYIVGVIMLPLGKAKLPILLSTSCPLIMTSLTALNHKISITQDFRTEDYVKLTIETGYGPNLSLPGWPNPVFLLW